MISELLDILTWPYESISEDDFNIELFNRVSIFGFIDVDGRFLDNIAEMTFIKLPSEGEPMPVPHKVDALYREMREDYGMEDEPDSLVDLYSFGDGAIYWTGLGKLLRATILAPAISARKKRHKQAEQRIYDLVSMLYSMDTLAAYQDLRQEFAVEE